MNRIIYKNLIAFHPGCYVKEYIKGHLITQEELAKRLQVTPKYISTLVNGNIPLTGEMALKLATVFGTSTELWLNLNQSYIEKKLEIERQKRLDKECELVKFFDYKFFTDLKLVKNTRNLTEKAQELLRFFKVSSLSVLKKRDFLVQFKTSVQKLTDINIMNANAWVQTALNIGSFTETKPFDKKKLERSLPEIRSMTLKNSDEFYPRLKEILASCGVSFVLLPNLKNCGISGAVKWLGKEKVLLALLNDRREGSDTFWFSLFHELSHVMQQRKKALLISDNMNITFRKDSLIQQLEREADNFAQETLIPKKEYNAFLAENQTGFTEKKICCFAEQIKIHPGIVVGCLQREKKIDKTSRLNRLKEKYDIRILDEIR